MFPIVDIVDVIQVYASTTISGKLDEFQKGQVREGLSSITSTFNEVRVREMANGISGILG